MVVALALLGVAGCGDGDDEAAAVEEVAVCDDLRQRENELIGAVNEALAALGDAEDDEARTAAIADGFDRLVEIASAQAADVRAGDDGLADALARGAQAAVAELEDERDAFAAEVPVVTQADEHGRAGELQNALEKAFSVLEPPRSAYVDAGLAEAIDADPDCRFVTQRADPAR